MKLHLGCGTRVIPGWVHVDACDLPHVDHVHAVDHLPFCADDSVEVVYASHVLEHFAPARIPTVLQEWHRVLQPGGTLRLSVPDFAACCRVYHRTGSLALVRGLLYGGQDHALNHHHTVFDRHTLQQCLEQEGFHAVRTWDWRDTEHADVDDYSQAYIPHMDKLSGEQMSLNVECDKRSTTDI